MALVRQRTQLKNRLHATLAKYALHDLEVSDLFGVRGATCCGNARAPPTPHRLRHPGTPRAGRESGPPGARVRATDQERVQADAGHSASDHVPGVGLTLAVVIALEIGDVTRFPDRREARQLRRLHRRVHASGDKLATGGSARTSTATSSGRSSKPRTRSVCCAAATRTATSVDSTSASPGARAIRRPSGRWPASGRSDVLAPQQTGSLSRAQASAVSSTGDKRDFAMSSRKLEF